MAVLASVSLATSVLLARPERGENYLRHDAFAQAMLSQWPEVYSPLPELFLERTVGIDDDRGVPVAFGACSKVLLAGAGASPMAWPVPCQPAATPEWCRSSGALCYATRTSSGYAFSRAPSQPAFVPSASRYAWTTVDDFDWLGTRLDWPAMRVVRAGATESWVRRAEAVRYIHTVQSGTELLAWVEPLDGRDGSVTVSVPAPGRACSFDLASRTPLPCRDLDARVETPLATRGDARTMIVIALRR